MKVLHFHAENAFHVFLLIKKACDKYKRKKNCPQPSNTQKEKDLTVLINRKSAFLDDSMNEINRQDLFSLEARGRNDTLATHLHIYPANQHASISDAGSLPLGVFALLLQVKETMGEMFN